MVILSDMHSAAATFPVIVLVLSYFTLTTRFVARMLQFYRMLKYGDTELLTSGHTGLSMQVSVYSENEKLNTVEGTNPST